MNRGFPIKLDTAELPLDPTTVRFGKQRLVKKKKLSHLKAAVLAEDGALESAPVVVEAPSSDSPAGLLQKILGDLARFQKRAKEENPLKAAKAQRLVFGLREISRSLESQKPPIAVVAASNIRDAPVLEELVKIENACKSRGVKYFPNLLSRNQLGRAAGKTVRQTAVAIVSVEGANATWKSLLALLT